MFSHITMEATVYVPVAWLTSERYVINKIV